LKSGLGVFVSCWGEYQTGLKYILVVGAEKGNWHSSSLVETDVFNQVVGICNAPIICAIASSYTADVAAAVLAAG
jgi:hypothetical protein